MYWMPWKMIFPCADQGWEKNWKIKKNNYRKNRTVKKNRLNYLKFWKNRPVRFGFGFISLKLKKTNRTQTELDRKKTESNGKNRAKPVWTGFGFLKKIKNFGLVIFFFINRAKLKIIIHMSTIFSPVYFSFNFSRLKWIKF